MSFVHDFRSFGALLKFLRRRARLTQRELGAAVGYSEAHISRMEKDQRLPDAATVAARFLQPLDLHGDDEWARRLLGLATQAHAPDGSRASSNSEAPRGIPSNLPLQLTSFIGRASELGELARLTRQPGGPRLITLTGPGGVGKTRLALETAFGLLARFPDGIWLVDLAPLPAGEQVAPAVCATLDLPEDRQRSPAGILVEHLRDKTLLLLLDNCEHLRGPASTLADQLLSACSELRILATSRELLGLPGELAFGVPGLSVPGPLRTSLADILAYDAVQLFVGRARAAAPDFELTEENALVIGRVCSRLDGLPLAIELAASRADMLRIEQIDARLHDPFGLLTGGVPVPARHETLLAAVDWSYALLDEAERVLLQRLSTFRGGWTLEACNAVCGRQGDDLLDLLRGLVRKSLVVVDRRPGEDPRYRLLETIREFARQQLLDSGDLSARRDAHLAYFCDLARRSRTFGPEKLVWLNRLEAEQDNFRCALAWALEAEQIDPVAAARLERALELAGRLADQAFYRGYSLETRAWLDRLLRWDFPPSPSVALGLQKAGFLARVHGEYARAIELLQRGLQISLDIGDLERAAWSHLDLATAMRDLGLTDAVVPHYEEALRLFEGLQDQRGVVEARYMLAETLEQTRAWIQAQGLWEDGLELAHRTGDKSYMSWGLEGLAGVAFLMGGVERSIALHTESLSLKAEVMDKAGISYSFEGLAQAAAAQQDFERAARLWGAADRLRQSMALPLDPSRRHIYVSLLDSTRDAMGEAAFAEAYEAGRGRSLDESIALALRK